MLPLSQVSGDSVSPLPHLAERDEEESPPPPPVLLLPELQLTIQSLSLLQEISQFGGLSEQTLAPLLVRSTLTQWP